MFAATVRLGNLFQNEFYSHCSSYHSGVAVEMLDISASFSFMTSFPFCSYGLLQIGIYLSFENVQRTYNPPIKENEPLL